MLIYKYTKEKQKINNYIQKRKHEVNPRVLF